MLSALPSPTLTTCTRALPLGPLTHVQHTSKRENKTRGRKILCKLCSVSLVPTNEPSLHCRRRKAAKPPCTLSSKNRLHVSPHPSGRGLLDYSDRFGSTKASFPVTSAGAHVLMISLSIKAYPTFRPCTISWALFVASAHADLDGKDRTLESSIGRRCGELAEDQKQGSTIRLGWSNRMG